jgi:hypothetical protein
VLVLVPVLRVLVLVLVEVWVGPLHHRWYQHQLGTRWPQLQPHIK